MARKSRKHLDDEMASGGLSVKRVGKSIQWHMQRTSEEFADSKQRLWESRPRIVESIRNAVTELTLLIEKYSSFDLVANLWLKNGIFNPETYREWDAPQRPHFIEYAALIELKSSERRLTAQLAVQGSDVVRAHELMDGIFRDTMWYLVARNASPRTTDETEALRRAEYFGILRHMVVGPPAYTAHWGDVLDGIFGSSEIDRILRDALGLSYKDFRLLADGVGLLMGNRIADRVQEMHRQMGTIEANLERYMSTGKFEGTDDEKAVLDQFRNMRAKERKRAIHFMLWSWAFVALADQLAFTTEELAMSTGADCEAANHFLNIFKVETGSTPKGFLLPSPQHTMDRRPIVKLESKWFCPVPHRLLWAIKPAVEEALQKHPEWETYQKCRADFLISQAVSYFKNMLPGAICDESVFYPFGNGQEAELDALIIYDRYALLIEGKAGTRSHGTKGDAFKARLGETVGDATRQALRARDYFRQSELPLFRRSDGSTVQIDKSRITDLIPICISLESLDVFTSELAEMRNVLKIAETIWAVCLTDLREITEIISRPSEFTHYMRWRLSIGDREDVLGDRDELNWLGIYLKNGPVPPTPPDGFDILNFSSHTEDFDGYFMHKLGTRNKPGLRPSQHLPNPLPAFLDAIEASEIVRLTEITEAVLDCTFTERDEFAKQLGAFAYLSVRGRDEQVIFEGKEWVFVIGSLNALEGSLLSAAAQAVAKWGKSAIVLVADPNNAWRIAGGCVQRHGATPV